MQRPSRLSRREFAAVALGSAAVAVPVGAAPKLPVGVFVASPEETVELQAYAGHHGFGRLTMAEGLLADIPVVDRVPMLVCNLPHWWLQTLWFASQRIFYDDNAERRQLNYTVRRYSMTTLAATARALGDPDGVTRLLRAVGATEANPGYVIASVSNGAVERDYLAEVRPPS